MENALQRVSLDTAAAGGTRRWLLLAVGWIALALGCIGVLLPVLPTAPFLLVAVACFSRSSPAMAARLYRLPVAGRYLRDWQEGGISPGMKWAALGALWASAFVMLVTVAKTALAKTVVLALTVLVSLHFVWLPVRRSARRRGG